MNKNYIEKLFNLNVYTERITKITYRNSFLVLDVTEMYIMILIQNPVI